jgi:hypothetical protein
MWHLTVMIGVGAAIASRIRLPFPKRQAVGSSTTQQLLLVGPG